MNNIFKDLNHGYLVYWWYPCLVQDYRTTQRWCSSCH